MIIIVIVIVIVSDSSLVAWQSCASGRVEARRGCNLPWSVHSEQALQSRNSFLEVLNVLS